MQALWWKMLKVTLVYTKEFQNIDVKGAPVTVIHIKILKRSSCVPAAAELCEQTQQIEIHCLTVPTLWHVLIWSYPLHPLSRVSGCPPGPVIRSFLHFREQQTSEAVWTFPVEWSQQPHDLTNGDKHKPALTSATLHSNKEMEQVQPNKSSLQVLCVCASARVCVCPLSSCRNLFCTLITFKWFLACDSSLTTFRYTACFN